MTTLLCSSVYNKVGFFESLPSRSAFLPPVRKPTSAVTKSRLSLARGFDQSRYSRYVTRAACRVREADRTCVPGLTSHVPTFLVRPDRQRQGQERSTRLRQASPTAGGGSHEPSLIKPKRPHAVATEENTGIQIERHARKRGTCNQPELVPGPYTYRGACSGTAG